MTVALCPVCGRPLVERSKGFGEYYWCPACQEARDPAGPGSAQAAPAGHSDADEAQA